MFNWFKGKEQKKQDTPVGVSEPVISFVETFKANPKRFKLRKTDHVDFYYLYDSKEKMSYEFYYYNFNDYVGFGHPFKYDWLTDEEKVYINTEMKPYYEERIARIIVYRTNKRTKRERQKYMKIYCKSN